MSAINNEIYTIQSNATKEKFHADSIDLGTSSYSADGMPVTFDGVLKRCGDLGRFQFIHFFFISLIPMAAGVAGFYYVFGAAEPVHRCRLPENIWPNDSQYYPINSTHERLINNYIPKTKDGDAWEKCVRYNIENQNDTPVDCPNGWAYDRSVYGYPYTVEADFVCNRASQKSWLATLFQIGGLSVLIAGSLGDKYGRKKLTIVLTILLLVILVITQIVMQWVHMSTQAKFIIVLINQLGLGLTGSTYSITFILMLELTSSAHAGFAGNAALITYTFGEIIVILFAYVGRNWLILKWASTAFFALVLPYLYFMPESPFYIYSKRQYSELQTLLRQIATKNKRKEDDWYPYYQEFIRRQPSTSVRSDEATFLQSARKILTDRQTITKLLIIAVLGFTTLMLYIKISYGLAGMKMSPYIGLTIGAVVEAAGYITGSSLISTKLARKGSFILLMSQTIISVILIPIILPYSPMATIFIAQFGKYSISASIAVSWIFVPELFPTSIRASANGFFIAVSRIGAILAPIIDTSVKAEHLQYTFYGSAALAIIVVLLTLILPETKDKPMVDESEYARRQSILSRMSVHI